MTERETCVPISQRPRYPVLGKLFDVGGGETSIRASIKPTRRRGPIPQLRGGPNRVNAVYGFDLVDEQCGLDRSDRLVGAGCIRSVTLRGQGTGARPRSEKRSLAPP